MPRLDLTAPSDVEPPCAGRRGGVLRPVPRRGKKRSMGPDLYGLRVAEVRRGDGAGTSTGLPSRALGTCSRPTVPKRWRCSTTGGRWPSRREIATMRRQRSKASLASTAAAHRIRVSRCPR